MIKYPNFILFALFFFSSFNSFSVDSARTVTIGSKTFSESIILAEIAAQILESKGVKVERRTSLGGTKLVFEALKEGDIDLYPEYTGTGYVMILKKNARARSRRILREVTREFKERFNLVWSKPIGFNNTYALAVRKGDPRFLAVEEISDLTGKAPSLSFAAPHEFMERADGFLPFIKSYNLKFPKDSTLAMNSGLMYSAIRDKEVDVIMSYSTDGRIQAYDLKLLKDDRGFFPSYLAAYLARESAVKRFPEIAELFKETEGLITEKEMARMNAMVDREKKDPAVVARNFLIAVGIIEGEANLASGPQDFFSYAFSKRSYLWRLVKEHLYLSFGALLLASLISLPIGAILTRKESLAKVVFPFVNTAQTIPSLALLGFLVPITGIGYAPALAALFLYSLLPLIRNTYTGLNSVEREVVEAAKGIGLTDFQILRKVEIPLALPVILAGARTASVIVIGAATLAALVGAGGLGDPIFRGVATVNNNLILLGAVPASLLAVATDKILGFAQSKLVSKGLRL